MLEKRSDMKTSVKGNDFKKTLPIATDCYIPTFLLFLTFVFVLSTSHFN